MKNLNNIDWNVIKRYTSPQAVKDFDAFLDALPVNAGYNALIAAGIAWIIAGGAVLFTSMEVDRVSTLRTELAKVESLQPPIPLLNYFPVGKADIDTLGKKITATYPGLSVVTTGDGKVTISASDTDYFPQFLAGVSTMQYGGKNWRVTTDSMCAGIECKVSKLVATLKVDVATIGAPRKEEE